MAIQQEQHAFKGMQRDLTVSKFSPEYYFDAHNIRITAREDSTLLSITNEKGTKEVIPSVPLMGTALGHTVLNNTVIVFTTETRQDGKKYDHIYKLVYDSSIDSDRVQSLDLIDGMDIGLAETAPIECFAVYENSDIQKVYWVDGINKPRMINIVATEEVRESWKRRPTVFDFSPEVQLLDTIEVIATPTISGSFSAGVVQYAFTYMNNYGVETPVINTSGLHYVAFPERGGSPEDKISTAFAITLSNLDTNFDKVKIYAVHRASIDGIPDVRELAAIDIDKTTKSVYYVDTNLVGSTIDATKLLFQGGDDIIAGTMTNKDQVLFFGNIRTNRPIINNLIKNNFSHLDVKINELVKVANTDDKGNFYANNNSLSLGANNIKYFKRREWYRIGIQFQYKNGQWSEVIFIKDVKVDSTSSSTREHLANSDGSKEYFYYPSVTIPGTILNQMYELGYRRARLAVSFPNESEREVVCQGMICPTVFNVKDRYDKTCFSQASWFARPFPAYRDDKISKLAKGPYNDLKRSDDSVLDASVAMVLTVNQDKKLTYVKDCKGSNNDNYYYMHSNDYGPNPIQYGELPEYRDFYPLPPNYYKNCEIQCNCFQFPYTSYYDTNNLSIEETSTDTLHKKDYFPFLFGCYKEKDISSNDLPNYINHFKDCFMVDNSIVTLHSPDIEFNENLQNLNSNNLKLRIVGVINLTSNASDLDIQTKTPVFGENPYEGKGFYKEYVGSTGRTIMGGNIRIADVAWIDAFYGDTNTTDTSGTEETSKTNIYGYYVYPWHASRSLLNQSQIVSNYRGELKYGELDKKKLSNMRYSAFNTYFRNPFNLDGSTDSNYTGISGIRIWNSKEDTIIKIPAPANSGLEDFIYKGNIDKIITPDTYDLKFSVPVYHASGTANCTDYTGDRYKRYDIEIKKDKGYPIVIANAYDGQVNYNRIYKSRPTIFRAGTTVENSWKKGVDKEINSYGTDPVRMKYKSTPHAVIALNYRDSKYNSTMLSLPTTVTKDSNSAYGYVRSSYYIGSEGYVHKFFWDSNTNKVGVGNIIGSISREEYYSDLRNPSNPILGYSYFFMGEIYRDEKDVANRFGGTSNTAIENNVWVPQPSKAILKEKNINIPLSATVGDTFYMRYDCLKTYPFTLEDPNSIVDIVSFKCETKINLDGRYDRNRGSQSNLVMTPENFNKMNPVYNQTDNFWIYRGVNPDRLQLNTFPNGITWSKEKIPGEEVDTWTQISLSTLYNLNGEKGKVTSLNTFNNELYAFQEHGLSHLLYNARVQVPVSDGVPIEISNGAKMGGSIYLSEIIGCQNKWSIAESPMGLYFVDNDTNAIYLFNGQIDNLSDKLGFKSWMESNNDSEVWDPVYWHNFRTHYDRNNGDVYFTTKNTSLCFAEPIMQFTSFMSYERVPVMYNVGKELYSLKNSYRTLEPGGPYEKEMRLWQHFKGDYNMFYDMEQPYSVEFISNAIPTADKIFNILEFRADSWYGNKLLDTTFDTLEVWNEYQRGTSVLVDKPGFPSPIKRKFRVWRAFIPRDDKNHRDRIRNTWAHIKLSKNNVMADRSKTVLHDATVQYFV